CGPAAGRLVGASSGAVGYGDCGALAPGPRPVGAARPAGADAAGTPPGRPQRAGSGRGAACLVVLGLAGCADGAAFPGSVPDPLGGPLLGGVSPVAVPVPVPPGRLSLPATHA